VTGIRCRGGTPGRAVSRRRCRYGRSPRRAAPGPSRGALPSTARRPGRGPRSCSSRSRSAPASSRRPR